MPDKRARNAVSGKVTLPCSLYFPHYFAVAHLGYRRSEIGGVAMKKMKHENELFKAALLAGVEYAEGRGVVEFEPTDSASEKLLYIYRLLVHDKVIQPLPEEDRKS